MRATRLLKAAAVLLFAVVTAVAGGTVDVQILSTTDLHGFAEHTDRTPEGGGWLRLATLIRQQRAAAGAEHTLLVDCGDTTQGDFLAYLSQGQCSTALLKALKYDLWVPGNHEFDFGVQRAWGFCQTMKEEIICGNLEFVRDGHTERFPAFKIVERAGVRIAVIGATASYLEQWLWGQTQQGYKAEKVFAMLERVMPEVHKANPDMIVLAVHQGWLLEDPRKINEIPEIADRFPEIDLILGGHTHRDIAGMKVGSRTWYAQAGYHAANLAAVQVKIDTDKHAVTDIRSELLTPTAAVALDAEATKAVQSWLDLAARQTREAVGQLTTAVAPAGIPGESCAVSELFCQAFAASTGADVAFHGKLSPTGLPQGPVTAADIFAMVPFENTIGVGTVSGAELRQIIEEQLLQRETGSYNGVWGVEAKADRDRKLVSLRDRAGKEIAPEARVKIALNSYVVAGGGGRFPVLRAILRTPQAGLRDTNINSRDAVSDFLAKHRPLELKPRRWLTIEGTPGAKVPVGDIAKPK